MGVLRRLLEALAEITLRLDEEVEKGYDLGNRGDQMKFLHALQLQAQMAIGMVLRLSSLLGHPPSTPLDAARHLLRSGLMGEEEYRFFPQPSGLPQHSRARVPIGRSPHGRRGVAREEV